MLRRFPTGQGLTPDLFMRSAIDQALQKLGTSPRSAADIDRLRMLLKLRRTLNNIDAPAAPSPGVKPQEGVH